jgi:adenylate cyclase
MLVGAAASLIALAASSTAPARAVEEQTYDWRLRATARRSDARSDIALILINESSLRALEPMFGRWPWPRMLHAGVIDFLARGPARAIAIDVLFLERDTRSGFEAAGRQISGAESDGQLVQAVRKAGNVVLLADATFEGLEGSAAAGAASTDATELGRVSYRTGPGFESRQVRLPFPDLTHAAAGVGHNFTVKTQGVARRAWPFVDVDGAAVPALGVAAALLAGRIDPSQVQLANDVLTIGPHRLPLLTTSPPSRPGEAAPSSRQVLLNFHGPYQTRGGATTYPVYSFFDVLLSEDKVDSGEKPPINPSVFRDKVVFVGTSAAGLADIWESPFGGAGMPGVQLHAALADDILSGRFMSRASGRSDVAWTIAVGVSAGTIATVLPVVWGVPLALVLTTAFVAWATNEIGHGWWIALVAPSAAAALATFGGLAWQYFVEGREKRRVTRLFGRYVSKDVFDHLMADPAMARLGGERRDMTVLFSDIRGFTSASERHDAEAIVQQLNEYFTAMVQVLFRHQGTLDKFVGDMVMGLFGAPVSDTEHADHAVDAAIDMMRTLDELNVRWARDGRPRLDIGIGINSGEMIVGNIGSHEIMSYTVIGDAVNLGARLESLNKDYGTRILIGEETKRRLKGSVRTREIGAVTVKGKTQPVTVFEVMGAAL